MHNCQTLSQYISLNDVIIDSLYMRSSKRMNILINIMFKKRQHNDNGSEFV